MDFLIVIDQKTEVMKLDDVDFRLLAQLQHDARTPIADLADASAASTASVQRRLRRLRQAGIIQGDTIRLNRHCVGFSIKAVISIELERDSVAEIEAFKRSAMQELHIQHCYCVAGEVDFIVIVVAKDMADYEAFTQRFFFSDRNVRKFKTSIVVSEQKASNMLPLQP